MENKAQIKVISTNIISKRASLLFLSLNCKGVNAILNIIFSMKGNKVKRDICDFANIYTAVAKVMIIPTYRIDHTGPNSFPGGAQNGFFNCLYHKFIIVPPFHQIIQQVKMPTQDLTLARFLHRHFFIQWSNTSLVFQTLHLRPTL